VTLFRQLFNKLIKEKRADRLKNKKHDEIVKYIDKLEKKLIRNCENEKNKKDYNPLQ